MKKYFSFSVAVLAFVIFPFSFANAAEEIGAYCTVPAEAVAHGSTVPLTIKFSDSDKSNDFIVQGPFKVLRYDKNGKPIIVDFKRANEKDDEKDDTGKENTDKPTLAFSVTLIPKHKLPAPATEEVTFTYFVSHKEGKRGSLSTANREQQVDCSFTVAHEIDESATQSGGTPSLEGDPDFDLLRIQSVGTLPSGSWYFLKEWKRGISRLFTFDATARAELELKITNEKMAEMLAVEVSKPDDADARVRAMGNYTDAADRLETRLAKLKENSGNPNVEKLLKKLDEQTLKHSLLLNQLAERWSTDPYVEDASAVNSRATRDNHLQGAVDVMQKKIQGIAVAGAEKDKDIKEKAEAQIKRAEEAILELKVRIDSTLARISTNMTIKRQTPKTDFGDRVKAGLETAGGMLANGKQAFAEGKFGEAFARARSAEVLARNNLRLIENVLRADTGGLEDDNIKPAAPPMPNVPMPIVPGKGTKTVPVEEKKVFPETNNKEATCGKIQCIRYQPVCGTDDKTYGCGEADASSCGVKVAYSGECKVAPRTEVKPVEGGACTMQYAPVCGTDGKTYGNDCVARTSGIDVVHKGECTSAPVVKNTGGYTFTITGSVHDATDAPAMTSGIPMAGIVIRAAGPKTVIAQTRADGSYTLSFTDAPVGTYDVCVALPSGYAMNPPSGCETVVVQFSEQYPEILEFINNGHAALKGTAIAFTLLRK